MGVGLEVVKRLEEVQEEGGLDGVLEEMSRVYWSLQEGVKTSQLVEVQMQEVKRQKVH